MPLYDYDCLACGRRVEVVHGVHAPGPTHCPTCGGGPLKKAIAAPAIHFKGSGWAKKERRATASPGKGKATEEGTSSGEKSAESGDGDKGTGPASKAGAAKSGGTAAATTD